MNESEIKYLELLSKSFPSIPATAAEIVRLQAILELPKTTEHFMSDIHGEYTYFSHILKNASGAIHDKINDSFGDLLGEEEKNSLARLLYYPERELAAAAHSDSWYRVTIHRPCGRLPAGDGQIYPRQGARPSAEGICLYYRGAH